ncbi:hypothetical protein ACNKHQ_03555 [Shigella flexneri]
MPGLAQADVAVAMNCGPGGGRGWQHGGSGLEPTKLIEVVRIGKQMLMTREFR